MTWSSHPEPHPWRIMVYALLSQLAQRHIINHLVGYLVVDVSVLLGPCHSVSGWLVPDGANQRSGLIFKSRTPSQYFMRRLGDLETSDTNHPVTRRHIPNNEDFKCTATKAYYSFIRQSSSSSSASSSSVHRASSSATWRFNELLNGFFFPR